MDTNHIAFRSALALNPHELADLFELLQEHGVLDDFLEHFAASDALNALDVVIISLRELPAPKAQPEAA